MKIGDKVKLLDKKFVHPNYKLSNYTLTESDGCVQEGYYTGIEGVVLDINEDDFVSVLTTLDTHYIVHKNGLEIVDCFPSVAKLEDCPTVIVSFEREDIKAKLIAINDDNRYPYLCFIPKDNTAYTFMKIREVEETKQMDIPLDMVNKVKELLDEN